MGKEERMYQQLAFILRRLDTFPYANHEARMLGDCIRNLVLTIAGENIDMMAAPGGGTMLQPGQDVSMHQQDYEKRGGVKLSENCIQYPPQITAQSPTRINQAGGGIENSQGSGALVDIQAGIAAMAGGIGEVKEQATMPEPIPGSLMAAALGGQAVNVPADVSDNPQKTVEVEAMKEIDDLLAGPLEAKLKITSSEVK